MSNDSSSSSKDSYSISIIQLDKPTKNIPETGGGGGSFDDNFTLTKLHRIRQEAWEVAYSHIYCQDEIDQYFNGRYVERRTWPSINYDLGETYIALCSTEQHRVQQPHQQQQIIGYAKWCFSAGGKGELQSLYVLPKFWNAGCGSMLWDRIVKRCREENVTNLDIWVLDRARSKYFYMSKGCSLAHTAVFGGGSDGDGDAYVLSDASATHQMFGDYFIGQHKEKAVCYRKMDFTSL